VAAPAVATIGAVAIGTNGSSVSVGMPSGIVSGDLLLLFCAQDGFSVVTTPSGWTSLGSQFMSSAYSQIFAKLAAGSDTVTAAAGGDDYAHVCIRVTGHNVVTIGTDLKVSAIDSSSGADANPSSFDAGSVKEWLWITKLGVNGAGSFQSAPSAQPSGWTSVAMEISSSEVSHVKLGVASKDGGSVQTQDPGAWTHQSGSYATWTLAVPPAAAVATSLPLRRRSMQHLIVR